MPARCRTCGAEVPDRSRFCPECGTAVDAHVPAATDLRPAPSYRLRAAKLGDRVRGVLDIVRVGAGARDRIVRLRAERERMLGERSRRLLDLGEAVYRGDETATSALRAAIERLDAAIADKEAEMERTATSARERVARTRLETEPTQIVPSEPFPPPGEADPPEPARVPEPYPPPGEADPPSPVQPPEPYPDPGEADPPEPARIPEPGPPGSSR